MGRFNMGMHVQTSLNKCRVSQTGYEKCRISPGGDSISPKGAVSSSDWTISTDTPQLSWQALREAKELQEAVAVVSLARRK